MASVHPPADRLSTVGEISRAVSSTLDLQQLYETIYREVGRVMDTTMFSIGVLDARGTTITLPYVREEGTLFLGQSIPLGGNLTSVVIEQGTPLRFDTNEEYQRFTEAQGLPVINVGEDTGEAVMFVPLHTGSRTIGSLSVESRRPHAYTEEDLETLTIIASQAAVAIENARLFSETQESIRQTKALLHVAQTLNQTLDLPQVLDQILLSIRDVFPYAYAAVFLADHASRTLSIVRSVGEGAVVRADPEHALRVAFGQGITGTVIERGEPLIVQDVRQFPGYVPHEIPGVHSEMAIPLRQGDIVVGVLDVGREGVDAFTSGEVDLLSLFASQATVAIENARLYAEQQQRVDELQTIQNIVRALTPLHEQSAIVAGIEGELRQLIDFHACRIHLLSEDGQTLSVVRSDREPAVPPAQRRCPFNSALDSPDLALGEGFAGWIARHGRADLIADTLVDPRPAHIPDTPKRPESMIGAPLTYEGRVRGVIVLSRLGVHRFDHDDLRLLEIVAAQVAIAFDRARLYDRLRREALTDPLVHLWNRRYLLERYHEERARARRHHRAMAALMLDIDRFKHVNDTWGHDAGDMVLVELAALIRSATRAEDIVARYGGEEFCVLLPECSREEAVQLGRRLQQDIASHDLPEAAGALRVTVSVGVAVSEAGEAGDDLFTRADRAMYRAKAAGGNRVCFTDGDEFELGRHPAG